MLSLFEKILSGDFFDLLVSSEKIDTVANVLKMFLGDDQDKLVDAIVAVIKTLIAKDASPEQIAFAIDCCKGLPMSADSPAIELPANAVAEVAEAYAQSQA